MKENVDGRRRVVGGRRAAGGALEAFTGPGFGARAPVELEVERGGEKDLGVLQRSQVEPVHLSLFSCVCGEAINQSAIHHGPLGFHRSGRAATRLVLVAVVRTALLELYT